jgi:lipid-A-disaccharide synthase
VRYFLSAGEASGDLHASQLIRRLRIADTEARFCFLGGDLMAAEAGVAPAIHMRRMAYMGFSEVLRHLPDVLTNLHTATKLLESYRPDALILIDYPSFNLKLARHAHRLGIPVYYYISPKVWAWKEYRVRDIRRYTRRVLSILPFEVPFYQRHGMAVDYVGNPSVEEIDARLAAIPAEDDFRRANGLDQRPIVAIVPGSRHGEIRNNLPVMEEAASLLGTKYQPVVAAAPGISPQTYAAMTTLPVVYDATTALMAHACVAMVTSGTATLECALAHTPQVVCYRANGSRLSYAIMRRLIKVDHVSLPNLIADATIIPEMLLHQCTPTAIYSELLRLLPGKSGRTRQLEGYDEMRRRLGTNTAAATAAAIIVGDLKR